MQTSPVQLWIAKPADVAEADWRGFAALLDASEQARAASFRLQEDRDAYVLAHALRRIALGEELNVRPSELVFSSEPAGRPTLIKPCYRSLGFSHAHTQGAVVFALSRGSLLGVDIEAHRPLQGDGDLLESFFIKHEALDSPRPLLAPESEADRQARFFFQWTALEAFWKAAGTGLSSSNPRVSFKQTRADLFQASLAGQTHAPVAPWVHTVAAPDGFSISLAVQQPDVRVFTRQVIGRSIRERATADRSPVFSAPRVPARPGLLPTATRLNFWR